MPSRTTKIKILLVIDVIFFFVEIISGYAVGSLALVADSFHMLNDVLSLIVALYAIKLTEKSETDSRYSYGWHRAEILAALINGVFLLALCFSIFLEALERFINTPEVSNPRLVVIVGAFGLASNIVGLLLFHEHAHGHGHSHSHSHDVEAPKTAILADSPDCCGSQVVSRAQILKANRSRSHSRSSSHSHTRHLSFDATERSGHRVVARAQIFKVANGIVPANSPVRSYSHRRPLSFDGSERENFPSLAARAQMFKATAEVAVTRSSSPAPSHHHHHHHHHHSHSHDERPNEATPLLAPKPHAHSHSSPCGHGHGSMNMRALVLHVLGDALGNVGVIATGLVIWKSSLPFKYYFDPLISLIITIIIFSSALPLVRSTSAVLMQGAPAAVSPEAVEAAILKVDGVLSLHELHIWQLSESRNVASVHVLAKSEMDFMPIAANVRKVLSDHGIHSSTIQPEYYRPGQPLTIDLDTSCLVPALHEPHHHDAAPGPPPYVGV